jgi:hypothetical protein
VVEGIWGIKQKKKEKLITDKWVLLKFYKKAQNRYVRAAPRHVSSDSGPNQSEIVLTGQNFTISAHCNESPQNRWIFVISPNTGGSKYFPHKYGGFLELTRPVAADKKRTVYRGSVDQMQEE